MRARPFRALMIDMVLEKEILLLCCQLKGLKTLLVDALSVRPKALAWIWIVPF